MSDLQLQMLALVLLILSPYGIYVLIKRAPGIEPEVAL